MADGVELVEARAETGTAGAERRHRGMKRRRALAAGGAGEMGEADPVGAHGRGGEDAGAQRIGEIAAPEGAKRDHRPADEIVARRREPGP